MRETESVVNEIEVESYVNTHSHLRHLEKATGLAELVAEGGADIVLPMPNVDGHTKARTVFDYIGILRNSPRPGIPSFIPSMMITEDTPLDEIDRAVDLGIFDVKGYPLYRTTRSHDGIRNYARMLSLVKHCGKKKVRTHWHPEHPWMQFGNRDAEFAFLPIADMLVNEAEDTTIIWEHGTDGRCIPFWKELAESERFFVTLTAHHPATNEDDTFGDVRATCKPPIKTEGDRSALVNFIAEDHGWVMAGLDDAPHPIEVKHVNMGKCACGAYTAPFGLPLYAHALDSILQKPNGVETFVNFTSRNARKLYSLPAAKRQIKLARKPFQIPLRYYIGSNSERVEPFWAGQRIDWSFA